MEAYDILTSVKQLEEAGMERSQSEAVARVIQAAVAPLAKDVDLKAQSEDMDALKEDMEAVKGDMVALKLDVTALRGEMKESVAELKGDIAKMDGRIQIEVNKMGINLTWRLATPVFLINGLFFAFGRTL